ncbi:MAG: hypothetical protein WA431_01855 [Candidatus Cybelea sp.]
MSNEFQRRPFANASMTVPTYRAVPAIDTSVGPAMCGVTKLCGAATSASDIDGGSLRSTIEADCPDLSALKGGSKRRLVDQRAARHVDEDRTALHRSERGRVDKVLVLATL